MNANYVRGYRGFAIAILLAAGVVMIIPAGCDSSGNGTAEQGPTLSITAENGEDVAATLVKALGVSFDLGEIPGEDFPITIAGTPRVEYGTGVSSNLLSKLQASEPLAAQSCPSGGIVDITTTVSDPNAFSVGDRIVAVFESCGDVEGVSITGTVDLTIAAIDGDLSTDVYQLGLDVRFVDIVMSDGESEVNANADFRLTLDSLSYPKYAMSLRGDVLELDSGTETIALTGFRHFVSFDDNFAPTSVQARVSGRLNSSRLNGVIDYFTERDISASGDTVPNTGRLFVYGGSLTSMRIAINSATDIKLEIDENGDGGIDAYISTTWAKLTGQT
jgi:hypothetical protein